MVTPYNKADASKKTQVTEMFDNIAPRYDLLNHSLTFGMDFLWRRWAISALKPYRPQVILDMATGTADFAIEARRLKPRQILGIDISPLMLEKGREKITARHLDRLIELRLGDSEAIDLPDHSVDAITVGFGVRNFENLEKGLAELLRVLKPGGAAVILEPSFPTQFPFKQFFELYFKVFTPLIGRMISGDSAAYTYLPASVQAFPNGKAFTDICYRVGYHKAVYKPYTFGACSCYLLEKARG
ncbi:MAG: bifunctional demethylmenaquinone methyltransferase/2-methoxy-6-polyprenyl-1,4-benzoquinol methylase UbiE [Bacteroidia bacterium]|nr:bifunctional demethylmenaquinone methyltransferase/2-methoxy-6-polyprenyl-1,4-benzoquinol methylase UbiE [Bacteroidia bacterium]